MTLTGLVLIAGLVVADRGLAHLHPAQHFEYLTLLVNCGGGFEAHAASTERQHVSQYSVCLDRSSVPVESARSASHCTGRDCATESAQEGDQARSIPDALHRWRL